MKLDCKSDRTKTNILSFQVLWEIDRFVWKDTWNRDNNGNIFRTGILDDSSEKREAAESSFFDKSISSVLEVKQINLTHFILSMLLSVCKSSHVLVLSGTELIFFTVTCMGLCFGHVLETVLINQECFSYC